MTHIRLKEKKHLTLEKTVTLELTDQFPNSSNDYRAIGETMINQRIAGEMLPLRKKIYKIK